MNFKGLLQMEKAENGFMMFLESSEGNLEFVLPHTTKGTAVEALANHWAIRLTKWMTIGDSENDLSMIRLLALV